MLALVVEKGGSGLLTLFGVATVVFFLLMYWETLRK